MIMTQLSECSLDLQGGSGSGGGAAYALPTARELTNKVDERVNNKSRAVTRADLMTDGYGFIEEDLLSN